MSLSVGSLGQFTPCVGCDRAKLCATFKPRSQPCWFPVRQYVLDRVSELTNDECLHISTAGDTAFNFHADRFRTALTEALK